MEDVLLHRQKYVQTVNVTRVLKRKMKQSHSPLPNNSVQLSHYYCVQITKKKNIVPHAVIQETGKKCPEACAWELPGWRCYGHQRWLLQARPPKVVRRLSVKFLHLHHLTRKQWCLLKADAVITNKVAESLWPERRVSFHRYVKVNFSSVAVSVTLKRLR